MNVGKINTSVLNVASRFFYLIYRSRFKIISKWCFHIFSFLFYGLTRLKVYKVYSASEYAEKYGEELRIIRKNRMGLCANVVWASDSNKQDLYDVPLPDLKLYKFQNVIVHRSSDLILDEKRGIAINDYCISTIEDQNRLYDDSITKSHYKRIIIVRQGNNRENINAGIMINGQYSFNYYHNLFENLIRLLPLKDVNSDIPAEASIIIDSDVERIKSLKEIFTILSGDLHRHKHILQANDALNVSELFFISQVNSLASNHRNSLIARDTEYVFDKEYLSRMRDSLLTKKSVDNDFPSRIMISRKGTSHRHYNEDELYEILKDYGFVKVSPEEYTFQQQMELFNSAKWIIGASGAAFSNLIFCSSKCTTICLVKYVKYASPVFTVPVLINGSSLIYFKSSKGISLQKAHSSFTIDVEQFKSFINNAMTVNYDGE